MRDMKNSRNFFISPSLHLLKQVSVFWKTEICVKKNGKHIKKGGLKMVYFADSDSVINRIVDSEQEAKDRDRYGLRDEQTEVARNIRSESELGE